MKKLLIIFMSVLVSAASFAQNVPPPNQYRSGAPPPGVPIDQYLVGLFFIGMIILIKYRKILVKN